MGKWTDFKGFEMIRRVSSDHGLFKALTFGPGLNILLAVKSEGATNRQSRNAAGKSSFVELVHFLLGADVPPSSIFRSEALRDWNFYADLDVGEQAVTVERNGQAPKRIVLKEPFDHWPVEPSFDISISQNTLNNENWKSALGALWFGLPVEATTRKKYDPTFRMLFPFSARRQSSGGFGGPTQHSINQQPWDQQVSLCYLLGLDPDIPRRFRELKDREKVAKDLRNAVRSGEVGHHMGTVADLRTHLTLASARTTKLRRQLNDFRIVPEYEELEREADEITSSVGKLNEENIIDRSLIGELRASIQEENVPDYEDLDSLYAETGIIFPDLPRKRFEQVRRFHEAVIRNRRSHLEAEITSAFHRIETRNEEKEKYDRRRQQIMGILQSGGALEHFTKLREELGRAEAEIGVLRERRQLIERLEATKTEIDLERSKLIKALRDDIVEREDIVDEAILRFESLSESLYERAGSLKIAESKSGPRFEIHMDSERSKGIKNMQIFCFDLMLTEICMQNGRSPGFLIHDSHLFDGVDERQVAKALQIGAARAKASGFQYIVTMNSDKMPTEGFGTDFRADDYVLDTNLTDATESGGLFGVRFNWPDQR